MYIADHIYFETDGPILPKQVERKITCTQTLMKKKFNKSVSNKNKTIQNRNHLIIPNDSSDISNDS